MAAQIEDRLRKIDGSVQVLRVVAPDLVGSRIGTQIGEAWVDAVALAETTLTLTPGFSPKTGLSVRVIETVTVALARSTFADTASGDAARSVAGRLPRAVATATFWTLAAVCCDSANYRAPAMATALAMAMAPASACASDCCVTITA